LTVDLKLNYSVVPNVTYSVANDFNCKLDVYARNPRGTVAPTVIYIHGGGWVGGTKEGAIFELLPYLEMGFHVINVEYRLARVSPSPRGGRGLPPGAPLGLRECEAVRI
jgi:acetyl esterase/lipase